MGGIVKIWYVSSQRLCNFRCTYCVSIKDYAKSNIVDWKREQDRGDFETIVRWIASQLFPVGVRLATLGEPFVSRDFMAQAAWLTRQTNVQFVELLTNGSLLKRRLPCLEADAELGKLSLWITHHHTETTIDRLIHNASFAQEKYGCFVVVNGLLFPDNADQIDQLRAAARRAGLRFNLDVGYDPGTATGDHERASQMAPILRTEDGIDGEVYPCSRYYVLKKDRLGNALDPEFRLHLRDLRWGACQAWSGCCNKEDFLNLNLKVMAAAWWDFAPEATRNDIARETGVERTEDNHAAMVETSLLMHMAPGLVRERLLADDTSERRVRYLILPVPDSLKTQTGIIYQASKASVDLGRRLTPAIVDNLVEAVNLELGS